MAAKKSTTRKKSKNTRLGNEAVRLVLRLYPYLPQARVGKKNAHQADLYFVRLLEHSPSLKTVLAGRIFKPKPVAKRARMNKLPPCQSLPTARRRMLGSPDQFIDGPHSLNTETAPLV